MKNDACLTVLLASIGSLFILTSCASLQSKPFLGGDDHDLRPHVQILGGDDHDLRPHGEILGGDDHDLRPHGQIKKEDSLRFSPERNLPGVQHMSIIGGDSHDYQHHGAYNCEQYMGDFEKFKLDHGRLYGDAEEAMRFQVFCDNMEKIKYIQKMERGTATYGINEFADLTEEEFSKNYKGWKPSEDVEQLPEAEIPTGTIPDSWDWRDHGAVSPVKNQGFCGSCWAFSVTGNIEGQWAIKNKTLLSLSEQELVDCDKLDQGCNGGWPLKAYKAIIGLGGLETEADYKYDGKDETCKFKQSEAKVKITGALNISSDEGEMAAWLYKNGPISIGINSYIMQFYWGGISHPWNFRGWNFCPKEGIDHGVLIVGYGVERGEPYWIIKNSWGARWGRHGYYYIYRGDGSCGLNTMCSSATV